MAIKKTFSVAAWVGAITTLFSLVAGVYGGWVWVSERLEKHRAVDRLLAAESAQLRNGDYEAAWNTLAQAAQINPGSGRVLDAQEDVAMRWLENVSVPEDESLSAVAQKVEPVLTRGATSAKSPQRQADLLAHVGWSYFLRTREESSGPDPESAYRDALQRDPNNPYAHAMWGHWILWNHQSLPRAEEHFTAALAAPRPEVRPYVRSLQLSALDNIALPESAEEMVRVANGIRMEHGELAGHWPHEVLSMYWEYVANPNKNEAAFLGVIPPQDHLDTFDWLVQMEGQSGDSDALTHLYIRSVLLESAGRRDEALAGYRSVQTRLGNDRSNSLAEGAKKAVERLGARK
jgi:tetratricopeptide (TPR) repeat protein